MPPAPHCRPKSYDKKIGLVLQGGGALGSYQAGVYEALAAADYAPEWIAGISIGALNGAIIAGNPPERRAERLHAFWERITGPAVASPFSGLSEAWDRQWHATSAILFGQQGFFAPRPPTAWLGSPESFYDTAALRETLVSLVDFDRINAGETRLSVGAANVRTGDFIYFDSRDMKLLPEHVMASGALPPAFPPVEIDGEFYWDGGLISNTPLQYMIDYVPRRSRLVFQIDLFNPEGAVPTDLDSALEREKDIRYSSRTRTAADMYRVIHDVRHNINSLLEKLPPAYRTLAEADFLYEFGCVTRMDVARLSYRPEQLQGQAKDYNFSPRIMGERWAQGKADAEVMLKRAPWLAPMEDEQGARVFDLHDAHPERHMQTSLFRASKS
jgi:NTE family protein